MKPYTNNPVKKFMDLTADYSDLRSVRVALMNIQKALLSQGLYASEEKIEDALCSIERDILIKELV